MYQYKWRDPLTPIGKGVYVHGSRETCQEGPHSQGSYQESASRQWARTERSRTSRSKGKIENEPSACISSAGFKRREAKPASPPSRRSHRQGVLRQFGGCHDMEKEHRRPTDGRKCRPAWDVRSSIRPEVSG